MRIKNFTPPLTLFCFLIISGCNAVKEPEYRDVKNFKLQSISLTDATAKMDVVYYNPNKMGFQVKSTDLDIYINDTYLGHTRSDSLIRVSKEAEFIIPVSAKVNMNSLFNNALAALVAKEVKVKISGTIKAGVAGILKNFRINYEGMQPVKF